MLAFAPPDYQSLCLPASTADPLIVLADGLCKRADIEDSHPNSMLS